MNFKIIFKQIYKGFLINWKLFLMLIIFCTTILNLIFGSLSFTIQFNQQIYEPAIGKQSFSVGYLNNTFSYSSDLKNNFKTNQKFENYFLNRINEIGATQSLTYQDLEKIYQNNGYVNWVETNNEQKEIYEKLINYSADFLGNICSKLMNEYLQTKSDWIFKIRNNQGNVAKLANLSQQPIHFYTTNLMAKNQTEGLLPHTQKIANDEDYYSAYVGEKQINGTHKIGDIVTLNFTNKVQSKAMKVKVIGTFIDYLTFSKSESNDFSFLIDNTDYFNFVKENFKKENQDVDYSIIDYRVDSPLTKPLLTLLTCEKAKPLNLVQQFSIANQTIQKKLFTNFDDNALNDEFSSVLYFALYQNNLMISLAMIGISFFLMILFFLMIYFLIAETIKKDLKISFFLKGLGMSYSEISFIQLLRLVIPILVSLVLAMIFAFFTKQLFWSAFASTFAVNLKVFYFHWLIILVCFLILVLILTLLFFLNFLINFKFLNHPNLIEQASLVEQAWMQSKKILRVKKPKYVISFAYGAKNTFQNLLIGLISLIIFTIFGFSVNFIQNIQNVSKIAAKHYAPIQSISHSSGPMVEKDSKNNYHFDYQFTIQELTPIGEEIDLKNSSATKIQDELEKLLDDSITNFYLSSNLIRQITPEIITEIDKNVNDENLKSLLQTVYLMNEELKNNFGWKTGFNVNFGQWNKQFLTSNDHHFLNFEGKIYDPQTNLYLRNFAHAFAVNQKDWFFQKEFPNLFDSWPNLATTSNEVAINAYFPMKFQKFQSLKITFYLNQKIKVALEIRNVGINKFDNWDEIFVLNKEQLFQSLIGNLKNESIKKNFRNLLVSQNFDQLDNGVYSSISTPFFYRNLLLRSDGKGQKIENFINGVQQIDVYGLNFNQVREIIVQKLSQFNQLITTILILLIFLMLIVSLTLIYLVVKENESYFQNFKSLGYSSKEISFFLLPWYLGNLVFVTIISTLIVVFTTSIVDLQLSNSLAMYLNYEMTPIGILSLLFLPASFIILITTIIYQFIKKVPLENAI